MKRPNEQNTFFDTKKLLHRETVAIVERIYKMQSSLTREYEQQFMITIHLNIGYKC
jgi:hypothetical protein